jgi:hypothetical protein
VSYLLTKSEREAARRESRSTATPSWSDPVKLWHVTDPKAAADIVKNGFRGGWGDVGFGVYFYSNMSDAVAYGEDGGWDHKLVKFAVLEAVVPDHLVQDIEPDPGWPNPEEYETVRFVPLDEGAGESLVVPVSVAAVGTATVVKKKPKKRTSKRRR